ncbi:MAG TPA: hypothetical protein VK203_17300 [Nostocaceae cyanobacterium]|nr:hypothetical protein [Nostocaceae cyanobacterium]
MLNLVHSDRYISIEYNELVRDMKRISGLWQITFPLCAVFMFGMGAFTTVYMVNGRYRVEMSVTTKGLKIKTDIDKNEPCKLPEINNMQNRQSNKSGN